MEMHLKSIAITENVICIDTEISFSLFSLVEKNKIYFVKWQSYPFVKCMILKCFYL